MKTLSIRQPWAWLIVNGHEDIENREWRYPPKFRDRFLIHAGKKFDCEDDANEWSWRHIERPEDFDMGGIVGEAELVEVVRKSKSPWFYGPLGFVLRNARPLPFMPCRGQLGFFEVDYPAGTMRRAPRPRYRLLPNGDAKSPTRSASLSRATASSSTSPPNQNLPASHAGAIPRFSVSWPMSRHAGAANRDCAQRPTFGTPLIIERFCQACGEGAPR
jgi:hypothetical protein